MIQDCITENVDLCQGPFGYKKESVTIQRVCRFHFSNRSSNTVTTVQSDA